MKGRGLATGFGVVLCSAALALLAGCPARSGQSQVITQAPPPPPLPVPVPANASHVVADVLKYSIWAPAALQGLMPAAPPGQVLYSITVRIMSASEEGPGLESLAQPQLTLEAFSSEPIPPGLVGEKIAADMILTGDTQGVRWWISNIRTVP